MGTLVVIRPGFLDFNLATFAALGTGLLYGIYLIITRKLHSTDSPLLTLLITGIVGASIGSFFCSNSLDSANLFSMDVACFNGYYLLVLVIFYLFTHLNLLMHQN